MIRLFILLLLWISQVSFSASISSYQETKDPSGFKVLGYRNDSTMVVNLDTAWLEYIDSVPRVNVDTLDADTINVNKSNHDTIEVNYVKVSDSLITPVLDVTDSVTAPHFHATDSGSTPVMSITDSLYAPGLIATLDSVVISTYSKILDSMMVNRIMVGTDDPVSHLEFLRDSYNYILSSGANSKMAFIPGGQTINTTNSALTLAVYPGVTDSIIAVVSNYLQVDGPAFFGSVLETREGRNDSLATRSLWVPGLGGNYQIYNVSGSLVGVWRGYNSSGTQAYFNAGGGVAIDSSAVVTDAELFVKGNAVFDKSEDRQEIKVALYSTQDEVLAITAGTPESPGTYIDTVPGVPQKNVSYIGDVVLDPGLDSQAIELSFTFSAASSTGGVIVTGEAQVNGVPAAQKILRKISVSGDIGAMSYHAIIPVTGGDTIGFYLDSDGNTNLTIKEGASWIIETSQFLE